MLPLLPRVHHLKLSPQGPFREGFGPIPPSSRPAAPSPERRGLLRFSEAATQSKDLLYLAAPPAPPSLFHFDGSAGVCKLLLNGFRLVLVDALFNGLGSAIHQVLGFFQAQAGNFADGLDYIDLIGPYRGQNDGKFSLFLSRRRARPPPPPPPPSPGVLLPRTRQAALPASSPKLPHPAATGLRFVLPTAAD